MILIDNFFTIIKEDVNEGKAEYRIHLNANHFIYSAHFPNNPITPGVCLIQMAVELFGLLKRTSFGIKTLKNVKFTAPINPLEFQEVDFQLEFAPHDCFWYLKASIKEKDTTFAKISMVLHEHLCTDSGL